MKITRTIGQSLAALLLGLVLVPLAGCGPPQPAGTERTATTPTSSRTESAGAGRLATPDGGLVTAWFFDVGQGDATLLAGPDFTILIDAGRHDRQDVVPQLREAGVRSIDLLIGTHPHADHIGQFPQVLEAFPVGEVWLSGDEHTTRTFERTLDAILASEAAYHEPRAGEAFQFGSARVEVINPPYLTGDFHEGCVSVRISYGDVSFVFTGDAETQTELEMIARGHPLRAQVLQLGHHGSRTSSSLEFLRAVQPEIAIYSAVADSSYGHPHREVVERLERLGIPLYGTPEYGTIRVTTDGTTYDVHSQRGRAARPSDAAAGGVSPLEPPLAAAGAPEANGLGAADRININTASLDQLTRIVHLGPERAEELIRLRPFRSLDELTSIEGIGQGRLREIRQQGLASIE